MSNVHESHFPLTWLSNEMLAGCLQRASPTARRAAEFVSRRVGAVARAHGSFYRVELDVVLRKPRDESDRSDYNSLSRVCGVDVELGQVRAACREMVMRRRCVTRLSINDAECDKRVAQALFGVLVDLSECSGSRLCLRSFSFYGDLTALVGEDGGAALARLCERHAATVTDCWLNLGEKQSASAFVDTCKALASCTAMQRFTLLLQYEGETDSVEKVALVALRDCIGQYSQLRELILHFTKIWRMKAYVIFEALVEATSLEQVCLNGFRVNLYKLTESELGVLASLRCLNLSNCPSGLVYSAGVVARLPEICPRLQMLHINDRSDVRWPHIRALVGSFFGEHGARSLSVELVLENFDSMSSDECIGPAINWLDDVAGLQLSCSNMDVNDELGIQPGFFLHDDQFAVAYAMKCM